jgi:hypothetical protein
MGSETVEKPQNHDFILLFIIMFRIADIQKKELRIDREGDYAEFFILLHAVQSKMMFFSFSLRTD